MSAYLVSKYHIDALIQGAFDMNRPSDPFRYFYKGEWKELTRSNASVLGQMLWNENYKSINARYNDGETTPEYAYKRGAGTATPGKVASVISCYEYQSCEHDEWTDSEAFAFCAALKEDVLRKIAAGSWGVDNADYYAREVANTNG